MYERENMRIISFTFLELMNVKETLRMVFELRGGEF